VASIYEPRPGIFAMDEYRRADGLPAQFPGGVATNGLPSLALIFHPHNVDNYEFACEGLSQWDGIPVWQVHFRQRPDKPSTIRSYRTSLQGPSHPVALKGRAWIAADTYQLVRLETDLVAPLPEIKLIADHILIDYRPVHFRETGTDLWLPQSAEVYFHWNNVRIHRRHTFSDYMLFSTDDRQKITVPKAVPPPDRGESESLSNPTATPSSPAKP